MEVFSSDVGCMVYTIRCACGGRPGNGASIYYCYDSSIFYYFQLTPYKRDR